MDIDLELPSECEKLIAIAKELEDFAYMIAGRVDSSLVGRLIVISAEIVKIEQCLWPKLNQNTANE